MLQLCADQFIDAPVDEVFSRVGLGYFDYQKTWDPAIITMVPAGDGPISVGSTAQITRLFRNRPDSGTSEVVAYTPQTSITVCNIYAANRETRLISCHPLQFGGTRLHVEITSELHGIARLIAPLTTNLLERALTLSLRAIKLQVEEEVHSHGTP